MAFAVMILAGIGLAALALTAIATVVIARFANERGAAVLGGLLVPGLSLAFGVYDGTANLEVDSPPPGMLLFGLLTVIALILPCTLLTSFLTIRFLRHRTGRKAPGEE